MKDKETLLYTCKYQNYVDIVDEDYRCFYQYACFSEEC